MSGLWSRSSIPEPSRARKAKRLPAALDSHFMISIIIPAYRHARALRHSLRSLSSQTYGDLETIVVNDGGAKDMAEEVASAPKNLSVKIINQPRAGAAASRNRGFKEAKGEYVIFWDADTIGRPDMLEKMLEALKSYPQASFVYSKLKYGWKVIHSHVFDSELLKRINYIDTTSLIRKNDFPASGWDESLKRFQDWDLWLTMAEQNKSGVFLPEVLYKKITAGRPGMSFWLPSFFYRLPWKSRRVREYEKAREIILEKHGITA